MLSTLHQQIVARDGGLCVWCSRVVVSRRGFPIQRDSSQPSRPYATKDHVIPRSKGGSDHVDNLVLACSTCNGRRRDTAFRAFWEACLVFGLAVNEPVAAAAHARLDRPSMWRPTDDAILDAAGEPAAHPGLISPDRSDQHRGPLPRQAGDSLAHPLPHVRVLGQADSATIHYPT